LSEQDWAPTGIDVSRPHPARVYDYHIGGKTNYPVDRELAERFIAVAPQTSVTALDNRAFLGRAVRYAAEQGIDQFLDIGTGIPAPGNTHEVAQEIVPSARVAYVDNDPIVLAHARALMPATDRGRTTFTMGDVREPEKILAAPEVREVIDFDRPVALMLVAILHFIRDDEKPHDIVARLRDALPSGSMLLLSHASFDANPNQGRKGAEGWKNASAEMTMRPYDEIRTMFAGFDLVEPGLRTHWNPDGEPEHPLDEVENVWGYGAVGIKP
jgi:hypothetical protein